MVDKGRVLFDLGPIGGSMLFHDLTNPMHLRISVRLDHTIDDGLIREAWEKTKRVYPIIDSVLEFDVGDKGFYLEDFSRIEQYGDSHMYLMEPRDEDGVNVPVKSKVALVPNTEHTGNRLIAVSYYGDTIAAGTYHALLDGRGWSMVFSTFLYTYLALYTGHEDEKPVVELREGRPLEEYYVPITPELVFSHEDFNPVPMYWLPLGCKGVRDPEVVYEEGTIWTGTIEADFADFMKLCKSNGANPSAMIATLLGRVVYALNPEEQGDIVFGFTISARDHLGLMDSIANVVNGGMSYATRDDIENKPLYEVAQHVRADLNQQRTRDYLLTYKRVFDTYQDAPNFAFHTVTYMGGFTIGDNDKHIVEMGMGTNGLPNLYLFQIKDRFVAALYFGAATQKYLDEFKKVFDELGVKAQITHQQHLVKNDVAVPVA